MNAYTGPLGIEIAPRERLNGAPPIADIRMADQARLIRLALGRAFPGVRFSVRSSHGLSIDVRWTDGPGKRAVQDVVNPFKGGRFDGMIDLAYGVESWLMPDGSVSLGRSLGSVGSHGVDNPYTFAQPDGAVLVSFGADYVFAERTVSREHRARVLAILTAKYGPIDPDDYSHQVSVETPDGRLEYVSTAIYDWPAI